MTMENEELGTQWYVKTVIKVYVSARKLWKICSSNSIVCQYWQAKVTENWLNASPWDFLVNIFHFWSTKHIFPGMFEVENTAIITRIHSVQTIREQQKSHLAKQEFQRNQSTTSSHSCQTLSSCLRPPLRKLKVQFVHKLY